MFKYGLFCSQKKSPKICFLSLQTFLNKDYGSTTVVGNNINIMKTTFELNFDFYQAFKQHGYRKIWKQREAVTLITCKLVIRKKLVNN